MTIYEITSDKFRKIDETSFSSAGLRERQDLQRLLRSQIEIVSPDTLIIAEEFSQWEDSSRRIDLLGIDKNANLVVIELKRTEDGGHMELQSIRYAAMISAMTFARAVEVFTDFLKRNGSTEDGPLDYAFELVRSRSTIIVGLLSILALKKRQLDEDPAQVDRTIDELLADRRINPMLWGESAVLFLLAIYFYLRARHADQRSEAYLNSIVENLAKENALSAKTPFPPAYLGVDEVLREKLIAKDSVHSGPENSGGLSMWLAPTVDLLAKAGYRQHLARSWYDIMEVNIMEFKPRLDWQKFLWRSDEGSTIHQPFPSPQSWQALLKEIQELDSAAKTTAEFESPVDGLLFLTVFPHRIRRSTMRAIDCGLAKIEASK